MIDCLKSDGHFQPCLTDENVKVLFDQELSYWGLGVERMKQQSNVSKFSHKKTALSKFNSANYEVDSQITYRFSNNDDTDFNTKDMMHEKDPRGNLVQKTRINLESPLSSRANSFIGQLRKLGSISPTRSSSPQKSQHKSHLKITTP